jgi:hypothetical protein
MHSSNDDDDIHTFEEWAAAMTQYSMRSAADYVDDPTAYSFGAEAASATDLRFLGADVSADSAHVQMWTPSCRSVAALSCMAGMKCLT